MKIRAPHCETCGKQTLVEVTCCGRCATDSNDPDRDAGRRRIDRRRKAAGYPPLAAPR